MKPAPPVTSARIGSGIVALCPVDPVADFERRYIERARTALGAAAAGVAAVLADRLPAPPELGDAPAIAGWWAQPDPGDGRLVLPNPWDDRDAIALHEQRCWEVTERLLVDLAPAVDEALATDHSQQYWRVL